MSYKVALGKLFRKKVNYTNIHQCSMKGTFYHMFVARSFDEKLLDSVSQMLKLCLEMLHQSAHINRPS